MATTYSIGGAVPTHATVSAFVLSQSEWLQGVYAQASANWRTYSNNLSTDALKTAAGIDFATYPDDKYRIDNLGTIMLQLKNLLEGSVAAQITDTRDFCALIKNVAG